MDGRGDGGGDVVRGQRTEKWGANGGDSERGGREANSEQRDHVRESTTRSGNGGGHGIDNPAGCLSPAVSLSRRLSLPPTPACCAGADDVGVQVVTTELGRRRLWARPTWSFLLVPLPEASSLTCVRRE
ncbi:hypothetical protein VTO73DRAFT_4210 [Trametes versicolor]